MIYDWLIDKKEKSDFDLNKSGFFKLTPIEKYNNIYFKRDDKFIPFLDLPINGGKVRQAISLIYNNFDYIKRFHNSTVGTTSSVHSPQGLIITKVAKEFGLKTILIIGGTDLKVSLNKYKSLRMAYNLGCEIKQFKLGYPSSLLSQLKKISLKKKLFIIKFGINLEFDPKSIINSVSKQVQNIPDNLDILVVPVGSGITMGGIIKGIIKYKKKVKNIIGIQIAGYDRTKIINKIINCRYNYKFYMDKTFPYSKKVKLKFNKEEYLDPIYEAKAFKYFTENFDYKNKKVLFWIVGNTDTISNFEIT